MQVNVLEAKNRLSELVRKAAMGEEVVIANRGVAVVRLMPMNDRVEADKLAEHSTFAPPHEKLGSAAEIFAFLERPLPDWMQRTAEEIDADIAAIRDGWD